MTRAGFEQFAFRLCDTADIAVAKRPLEGVAGMKILCPRHGPSYGMSACSHIMERVSEGKRISQFRVLIYEYLGETADGCAFCRECGDEHGIPARFVTPLPDVYPAYFPRSLGVCGKCFDEATGTTIDWNVRAKE